MEGGRDKEGRPERVRRQGKEGREGGRQKPEQGGRDVGGTRLNKQG